VRIRTVKPAFFQHGDLYDAEAALSKQEGTHDPLRLAYEGIWCAADREGRFDWKPRELKQNILPYDPVDFSKILEVLLAGGWIRRYFHRGRAYGLVIEFLTHQQINNREQPSTRVAPEDADGVAPAGKLQLQGELLDVPAGAVVPPPRPAGRARRTPRVKVPAGDPTWHRLACDIWLEAFPGSKVPGGQIVKNLQPLVRNHSEEEVLKNWRRYLQTNPLQFANAAQFSSRYSLYNGTGGSTNGQKQAPRSFKYEGANETADPTRSVFDGEDTN
jgi:hypothetical protein